MKWLLMAVGLLAACNSNNKCVSGQSSACTCTDGRMGAKMCQNGAFAACQCDGLPQGGDLAGTAGADLAQASSDMGGAKRVFVTATGYTGNLKAAGAGVNGLAGGDKLCANAATAALLG